ncbi:MAG TPA: alpha-amylase family protein [Polyangia bacterium]|jgi:alpha-amylase|nr:alpha-amylase family protein [Polyangia bacterium]
MVPAVLVPLALQMCGCGDTANPMPPADNRAPVSVHLFEWRWTDIAVECETNLGPAGFTAVQVSPPVEHAVLAGHPWWQRYQTVGYSVARSRSGTGEEFRDMVRRCAAAGVAIHVDAVINHMTAQSSGVGSNGTTYTKYSYPDLYAPDDFHSPPCTIADGDYQNAPDRVRDCELLGLADLNTSSDHVRDQIAGALATLVELGVRGFRIDAAKHVAPSDLDAILRRVSARVGSAKRPYYFFEVIDHGGEAIHAADYLAVGQGDAQAVDVTEFKYAAVTDAFGNRQGKTLAGLRPLGGLSQDGGGELLPADRAVVFINNHDTQRAASLFYQDGPSFDLATAFMLAWPYGHPSLLSSFAFDRLTPAGRDAGPPSDSAGTTGPVYAAGSQIPSCSADPTSSMGGWLCEHRRSYVAPLIGFRQATASAPMVTNWWDDGANQIAFGRGDKGFVIINRGATSLRRVFATALPAGSYCDVYPGLPTAAGCAAAPIQVDDAGAVDVSVAPWSAVVLHVGAQVRR